mgnify:CR=1 FL=1
MLLTELRVARTPHASQDSIARYIEMYSHRVRGAKQVSTSDPAVKLVVTRSAAGKVFIVFPLITEGGKEEIAGFVEFVWPDRLGQRRSWSASVRTPHSGLLERYQGRGIVKAIYRWFLDAGNILVTGDLQTPDSNALWRSLSRDYEVVFFNSRGEFIDNPTQKQATSKDVRMALLGKGQTRADIFKD